MQVLLHGPILKGGGVKTLGRLWRQKCFALARLSGLSGLPWLGLAFRGLSGLAWLGLFSENAHHSRTRALFSRNRFLDFGWILGALGLEKGSLFGLKKPGCPGLVWACFRLWPGMPFASPSQQK